MAVFTHKLFHSGKVYVRPSEATCMTVVRKRREMGNKILCLIMIIAYRFPAF